MHGEKEVKSQEPFKKIRKEVIKEWRLMVHVDIKWGILIFSAFSGVDTTYSTALFFEYPN